MCASNVRTVYIQSSSLWWCDASGDCGGRFRFSSRFHVAAPWPALAAVTCHGSASAVRPRPEDDPKVVRQANRPRTGRGLPATKAKLRTHVGAYSEPTLRAAPGICALLVRPLSKAGRIGVRPCDRAGVPR